jgi:phenylacetate-CoA ligase
MVRAILHTDLRNKYYLDWIQFLENSENWNREQIEEYQFAQLKRIIKHGYQNTDGYRKLYDAVGISPDSIKTISDIQKLPFVHRGMIGENIDAYSAKVRNRVYVTTGGSTGIPIGFYRTKIAFSKELASKAFQYYRIGWKEGDRQIVLRGLVVNRIKHMQYYPTFNELRCSSYHLVPEIMEIYRKKALDYKPEWLKCYPSSGYIFAKFLKETQRPFPQLKGILCASENLYDYQRDLLTNVFGARVFSHYGHYEMAALAGFCEHNDMYHVLPQYGYAELIDRDGKPVQKSGQTGEIIATSFIMDATPFIRYRTGDLAVLDGWGCSSCGRPYQIWRKIEGRLQEFIVTNGGRYISMTAINMHDNVFDHIKQFQFYQEKKGQVIFRYIPKDSCNGDIVSDMERRLRLKLGTDIELNMTPIEDIPLTKRGKHRFLIQKVKLDIGDE